jgi:hypothetical protein
LPRGPALGAGAGAVGGWLYDHHKKKTETSGTSPLLRDPGRVQEPIGELEETLAV